jgi:hypothetical protein
MNIGYSLVRLSDGAEIETTETLPRTFLGATFDKAGLVIPDSARPTHILVERVLVEPLSDRPSRVVSESARFDGARVLVTREYELLPAPRRLIPKSLVLERLTDEQLGQAIALMTQRQRERWRMPGKPEIYVDDPELLAVLQVVGADAETVLAPEAP